jgi:hypothetical protein
MPAASNVLVGKPLASGGILTADLGSTLPTDASTALDPAFTASGYASDAGVTQTIATDSTEVKAWGGDIVRRVQTSHALTYKFQVIETTTTNLGLYYGDDNVTETPADATHGLERTVLVNSTELPHKSFVIAVKDGTNTIRIAIPDGQVTDRGDVVYKDDESIAYDLTVECFADDAGNKAYLYLDDGKPTA